MIPLCFGQNNNTFYEITAFFKHNFCLAPRWKINRARWFFFFFNISRLKSLNLVLMPGAKLDGYRGTWAGCFNDFTIKRSKRVQCFSYPGELQYWSVFAMGESYWNFNFIEQIPSSHWSFTIYEKQVPNTRPVGKEI